MTEGVASSLPVAPESVLTTATPQTLQMATETETRNREFVNFAF
jgi:hypothetical protein